MQACWIFSSILQLYKKIIKEIYKYFGKIVLSFLKRSVEYYTWYAICTQAYLSSYLADQFQNLFITPCYFLFDIAVATVCGLCWQLHGDLI